MWSLFKKRVPVTLPDGRTVKIPEAQMDEWIREGVAKRVVEVIIHDDNLGDEGAGDEIVNWVIGEDVDLKTYDQFKDEEERLHVHMQYEQGEKKPYLMTKKTYEEMQAAVALQMATGDPSTVGTLFALKERAEKGNTKALCELAGRYMAGVGVPKNEAEALNLFRKAANQGDTNAQYALATMYTHGLGTQQNHREALEWYLLAADKGDAEAQNALGTIYDTGRGVTEDCTEAVEWFRLAADQGMAEAQGSLGVMYAAGRGVKQNYDEAIKWFRLAADQGLAIAQYNLAIMHDKGRGIQQDYAEAARLFRLAADQGFAAAQLNLGAMYVAGNGVPQDYVQAYFWFSMSAMQGFEDANKYRDEIARQMTPAQINEAEELALRANMEKQTSHQETSLS